MHRNGKAEESRTVRSKESKALSQLKLQGCEIEIEDRSPHCGFCAPLQCLYFRPCLPGAASGANSVQAVLCEFKRHRHIENVME